jgi:anaerobic magnesium-protoporphyrin IX monomethyl ester cyclase
MKILLADPPVKGTKIDDSYSNLGLLYLAGSLKAAFGEKDIDIAYLGPKHNLKSHLDIVKDFRPDIYGISFTSKAPTLSYATIKAVREACPNAWLVAGGCHPTALPEEVFSESPVDVVGFSEGEITFTEVVKAMAGRSRPDFESIQGIAFRRDGEIIRTPARPFIENLDTIPFPAWELVDFREYGGMYLKKQPIESSLLISRGCPFHCSFCSQPIWKSQKPWLRARSPENICQEIQILYDRGVREIYLSSDELNFQEKWAIDMCRAIAALKRSDLYFQCNLRADKVTPALVDALVGMNCWMVHLGVESANDRVLQGIGKKVTVAQIEEAVRLLSRAGIKVFAFAMLYQAWEENGELCFETTAEVENTLQWVKRMFRNRFIHYMSWQFCTPMPGARLFEIADKYHLYRRDPRKVWGSFDEHSACMALPGISERTMRWKLKKGIFLKDWFMVRSGNVSLRHVWRAWENIAALFK